MTDDELLVVAAESASLTPSAAAMLKEEVVHRRLTEGDVSEAQASLSKLRSEDDRVKRAFFNPEYAKRQLIAAVLFVVWCLLSAGLAQAAFRSTETQTEFTLGSCGLFAVSYPIWTLWTYWNKRRSRKRGSHGRLSA